MTLMSQLSLRMKQLDGVCAESALEKHPIPDRLVHVAETMISRPLHAKIAERRYFLFVENVSSSKTYQITMHFANAVDPHSVTRQ